MALTMAPTDVTKAGSHIADSEALVSPRLTGGWSTPPGGQAEPGAGARSWARTVGTPAAWLRVWARGIWKKGLCFCSLAVESPLLVVKGDE